MSGTKEQCVDKHLTELDLYDTEVDIVSCWETYLSGVYKNACGEFNFERYPIASPTDIEELRPSFTACFEKEYGLIGLLYSNRKDKHETTEGIIKELEKLDRIKKVPSSKNEDCKPEKIDILLIVPGSIAPSLGKSITDSINLENRFSKNIVLVRYEFNSSEDPPVYQFNRELAMPQEFRDDPLPDESSLSQDIGEKGGYKGIDVSPLQFNRRKTKHRFNNDQPPVSLCATYLWKEVFPDDLEDEDFLKWRQGNMRSTVELPSYTPSEIRTKINREYIRGANIKDEWVEDTLEFLCSAGRADRKNDEYVVKFTGVIPDKRPDEKPTEDEVAARAERFVRLYCDNEVEDSPKEHKTLDSFT